MIVGRLEGQQMFERVERFKRLDVIGGDVDDAKMRKLTKQGQVRQLHLPQFDFDEGVLESVPSL